MDGRITTEQVKVHVEALNSLLNIVDKEYSDRVIAVYKTPTYEVLAICLANMTPRSHQLDQYCGGVFMVKASEKTMATITERTRKNGRKIFRVEIRIKRNPTLSKSFDRTFWINNQNKRISLD